MKVKFVAFEFDPGEKGRYVQGIRGGYVPRGALYGGNGSFCLKERRDPSLDLIFEVGGNYFKWEFSPLYRVLQGNGEWKNLTERRIRKLSEKLRGTVIELENGDVSKFLQADQALLTELQKGAYTGITGFIHYCRKMDIRAQWVDVPEAWRQAFRNSPKRNCNWDAYVGQFKL